jgi:hypothetical protein
MQHHICGLERLQSFTTVKLRQYLPPKHAPLLDQSLDSNPRLTNRAPCSKNPLFGGHSRHGPIVDILCLYHMPSDPLEALLSLLLFF